MVECKKLRLNVNYLCFKSLKTLISNEDVDFIIVKFDKNKLFLKYVRFPDMLLMNIFNSEQMGAQKKNFYYQTFFLIG